MNSKYKEYYEKTSKFTEEDFKNPTLEMKNDIWWKIAYADWQHKNGSALLFDTAEDAIAYLRKSVNFELV